MKFQCNVCALFVGIVCSSSISFISLCSTFDDFGILHFSGWFIFTSLCARQLPYSWALFLPFVAVFSPLHLAYYPASRTVVVSSKHITYYVLLVAYVRFVFVTCQYAMLYIKNCVQNAYTPQCKIQQSCFRNSRNYVYNMKRATVFMCVQIGRIFIDFKERTLQM